VAEWNELPRPESIEFFEKAIPSHSRVKKLSRLGPQTYEIERHDDLPTVRLWLCGVYRVSAADVAEILAEEPETDAILTISNWNDVTVEGKEAGQEAGVGVFTFKHLMGALNYADDKFVEYKPPERNQSLGGRRAKTP
jgi:hypothetical protein